VAARLITTTLISAVAVLVSNGVAWAHAGGLTSSSNEPVVIGIQPPVPGLTVTAVEAGARLRLDNRTGQRVGVVPPPGSVINALPVVDPGEVAFWSDPRLVAASVKPRPPDARLAWRIPLRVGDGAVPVALVGEQRWPPPPDAGLWWLLTAGALVLPVGLVALGTRSSGRRVLKSPTQCAESPGSRGKRGGGSAVGRWVLAVATAVVMGAHVVHMYGSALVVAQGTLIWVFLAASGFAVVGWPIGAAGAWLTARGRPSGPLLCLVAGALLAIIIAPADVFSFHDAVIPFAWGPDLDRLLIALTVGGGLGVVAAAWLLMRRMPAAAPLGVPTAVPPAEASGGQG
jgi:hypothetical protein